MVTQEAPDIVVTQTQDLINALKNQIVVFRHHTLKIIYKNKEIQKNYALITSVKDIARASAIQLLSELLTMPKDLTVKQWIAYAGLDLILAHPVNAYS